MGTKVVKPKEQPSEDNPCPDDGGSNMAEEKKEKPERLDHDEIQGLHEGYAINNKRQIARELDLDKVLQEQYVVLLGKLHDEYAKYVVEMDGIKLKNFQAYSDSMDARTKDVGLARERHEKKLEERMEELEETMTRQVATINESIAGINAVAMQLSEVVGLLSGKVEEELEEKK
jgi:uncharacterized coiled-coil protein SlyX